MSQRIKRLTKKIQKMSENYEREAMSPYVAFFNIIAAAKQGKEFVLKDSYYDGGWFGAS